MILWRTFKPTELGEGRGSIKHVPVGDRTTDISYGVKSSKPPTIGPSATVF